MSDTERSNIEKALAEVQASLAGQYASADGYYDDRALELNLRAKLASKKPHEVDPMSFWFGHQSN